MNYIVGKQDICLKMLKNVVNVQKLWLYKVMKNLETKLIGFECTIPCYKNPKFSCLLCAGDENELEVKHA